VTDASHRGHETADCPARPGTTATAQHAVVRHRLRKAHADTGSHGGRHANEEGILALVRCKGGREDGREPRDGAVHQSSEAGLNNLEDKAAA
jgi:hypothetical protein